jgi:Phytanoyl-CoA dioxygenase (PhyH)
VATLTGMQRAQLDERLEPAFAGLERDGFAVVEDVLSEAEIERMRSRLVEVAAFERAAGIDHDPKWEDGPRNQRVFGLLNKGAEFVELVEHPVALALMEHLLDPLFLLSSITANITGPGGHPMDLHYDQDYVPQPWPAFPIVANIIWMLDEFTEHNGATRFIPGSHREDHAGWSTETMSARCRETIAVGGSAGSLVCLDGRVLHQTGANTTANELRHGIIAYYCQPWIRQQENFSLSVLPEMWPTLSARVRELAGLQKYRGLGCISGPTQRGFRYGDPEAPA